MEVCYLDKSTSVLLNLCKWDHVEIFSKLHHFSTMYSLVGHFRLRYPLWSGFQQSPAHGIAQEPRKLLGPYAQDLQWAL